MSYGGDKFSIGNIPKSTTNKTYSSLTVAMGGVSDHMLGGGQAA